ncbi:metallophosphoesterase family protein [Phreatobacter sp.]|uniref:metallophosphoesterase family protein n=1 Tax=Phreatobacter sp. TaxID=1966341 RepID=UPI003F72AACD
MRLAIIADIHGNAVAIEAVLADIAATSTDRIVNLGDVVSGPLWPRETLERLLPMNLATVRGNHDRWVATTAREAMYPSDAIAHDALTPEQRDWLGALPMELAFEAGGLAVRAFHGTPSDDNGYLMHEIADGGLRPSGPAAIAGRLGASGDAGLILCAHTHQPGLVTLPGSATVVLNPGSVGLPAYSDPTPPSPHVSEAGSPHARYALVTIAGGAVAGIDLRAIPYDWSRAAARATELGRPDWALALATGTMG